MLDLPKIKCPHCGQEAIAMFDMMDAVEYPCGTFQSTMKLDAQPRFSEQCLKNQKMQSNG